MEKMLAYSAKYEHVVQTGKCPESCRYVANIHKLHQLFYPSSSGKELTQIVVLLAAQAAGCPEIVGRNESIQITLLLVLELGLFIQRGLDSLIECRFFLFRQRMLCEEMCMLPTLSQAESSEGITVI